MTELFRASSVGNCLRWLFNPQALQFQEDRDGAFAESYYLRRKSLNESFRAEKDRAIAGRRIPSTESTSDSQYADNHYDGAPKNPYLVTFTKPYDPEVGVSNAL